VELLLKQQVVARIEPGVAEATSAPLAPVPSPTWPSGRDLDAHEQAAVEKPTDRSAAGGRRNAHAPSQPENRRVVERQ
jgi:cell division septation protein DedD